jgi:hypothetical protein
LNVDGNGQGSDAGAIAVIAGAVATGTTWNARGALTGWGGEILISALGENGSGTIATTSGTESFNAVSGDGGGLGGEISLDATGSITLAGDMDTAGQGDFSIAGGIEILGGRGAGDTVTVATSSRLNAKATGTESLNGVVDISACNIVIAGVIDTRAPALAVGGGTNLLTYFGTLSSSSGSVMADDSIDAGLNSITCPCVDSNPSDGACDLPNTCQSSPVIGASFLPAPIISYFPTSGCE